MSSTTALHLLPLIEPAQAQKHVTHNEALAVLDVLVQTSATSRRLSEPPVAVIKGACFIIAETATGDWQGEDGHVAVYSGTYWDFYVPKTGWRVWVEEESTEAVFDGAAWTTCADRTIRVAALGVSADSDGTNRLTVSSPSTLLTHAGAGHQVKVNKARPSDTASLLFQSGYSGRAEMGIVGSDDFVLKVSADGTTFLTGLTIEAATGRVVTARGINVVQGAGDPASPQNGDIWYNATAHRLRAHQGGQTVDLFDPTISVFGRSLMDDADAATARTTLERQDFATRAAFVGWAAGRSPMAGLVMRAANVAYRYAGTGTAIADLPGWVPYGTASALHWGADPTGTSNAVPAVSAMIDYVNAQGGGVAFLPAGTYLWTGEMLKSGLNNVVLEGEGNATKLLRRTNRPAAAIKFYRGANNRIRNLKIDCAGYSGIGIYLADQYSGAENVEIVNSPDRPFQMQGGGNASWGIDSQGRTSDDASFAGATFFPMGCYLENCRVIRAGSTAFSQKQMPHSRIQRCVGRTVYSEGITIDKCDYSVVSGNTLVDCALTTGNQWPDLDAGTGFLPEGGGGVGAVGIDGSTGARLVANTIIGVNTNLALNNRIRVAINFVNNIQASNGCEVEGNFIKDAKAGVWLKGTVSGATGNNFRCIIKGNVFDTIATGSGTGMAQYGAIWIDTGCTDNVITSNTQVGGTPLITGASEANTLDQMAAGTLRGNAMDGLALGQDLSGGQVTALLDTFSSLSKGLAPASGGGTSNFLRADGTWAPVVSSGADWGAISAKPTTLAGYGITDAQGTFQKGVANGYAGLDASGKIPATQAPVVAFADVTSKPTTLSGYGITDALGLTTTQTISGTKTFSAPLVLGGQIVDPVNPANGSVWYNATTAQLKVQIAGAVQVIQPGQDIPWLTPVSGEYMMTTVSSNAATSALAQVANQIRLFPFTARVDTPIRGLALMVTTGVAASVAKFVVYDSDGNGRPSGLLVETSDVDCSTAGTKTASAALTLRRGQTYWLGVRHNGTASLAAWPSGATPDINGGQPSSAVRKSVQRTVAYATPSPTPWTWTSSEIAPGFPYAIWLMV